MFFDQILSFKANGPQAEQVLGLSNSKKVLQKQWTVKYL